MGKMALSAKLDDLAGNRFCLLKIRGCVPAILYVLGDSSVAGSSSNERAKCCRNSGVEASRMCAW
jgi:hypothetical protein